jgi:hypothetical protein
MAVNTNAPGEATKHSNAPTEQVEDIATRRPVYRPPNVVVKPKIGRNVLGCVLYALLILAVFAAIIMVAVAKSGIVSVPFVSQWYFGPRPTRPVEAGTEKPETLLAPIRTAIGETGTPERVLHVVSYSEAELTAAVRGALAAAAARGEVEADGLQVVVRPDAVQLTGHFRIKGLMADTLIEFVPSAENGAMKITIVKAKFGDFPVAPSIAKIALDSALGRDSTTWDLDIAEHEIEKIALKDRALELTLF